MTKKGVAGQDKATVSYSHSDDEDWCEAGDTTSMIDAKPTPAVETGRVQAKWTGRRESISASSDWAMVGRSSDES